MAGAAGPLKPCDSWTTTEIRTLTHEHSWTIRGFSNCEERYLETIVKTGGDLERFKVQPESSSPPSNGSSSSSSSSPFPPPFMTKIHPKGNKESNKDFTFLQVYPNTKKTTKYTGKFKVTNSRNEELPTTVYSGTQPLHGYFEYIRRDILLQHISPEDDLHLHVKIVVTTDTVSTRSKEEIKPIQPKYRELSDDLESFLNNGKNADFKIEVNSGCEINCHKSMLAARSPVFEAMFAPHTEETRTGRVLIRDIDYEVMQEMLRFIYTGKAPENLSMRALDILAAADRFQLPGLKDIAEQFLRSSLKFDSAPRYLVYADMHNAIELRKDAILFIAANMSNVLNTDGWNDLVASRPLLVNEVLSALMAGGGKRNMPASKDDAPSVKRARGN